MNKEQTFVGLSFESVIKLENMCEKFKQSFMRILSQKIIVWGVIEKGCEHISDFIKNILKPMANIV